MHDLEDKLVYYGGYDILHDDEKLREYLNNLSFDKFKELLKFLNNQVVEGLSGKGEFHDGYMKVGALISPNDEIQERILEQAFQILKRIKPRKVKAGLMYYLINYLHLFSDGNGRTSRLVFKMLSDGKFKLTPESIKEFIHDDRFNMSYIDSEEFELNNRFNEYGEF